jgi:hypothetical protein
MKPEKIDALLDEIRKLNASVMRLEGLVGRLERNNHRHLKEQEIMEMTRGRSFSGENWEVQKQIEAILKRETPSCLLCSRALGNALWAKAAR